MSGGKVPSVVPERAKQTFIHLHDAIQKGLVRSCHDMSEGGLAVAVAEMAFAGGLGAQITTDEVGMDILPSRPDSEIDLSYATAALLFSESNTRFVVEITPDNVEQFKSTMGDIDTQQLGKVISEPLLTIEIGDITVIQSDLMTLKTAWQGTLNWK